MLTGRLQLDPSAFGECFHPEVGEELVGGPELGAGVPASALAPQPFAAAATAVSAQAEDASRTEGEAILVNAGTASLVAVGFTLADAGRSAGAARVSLIALAV